MNLLSSDLFEKTFQRAAEILLKENHYSVTLNGKTYHRTVPSKEFYVHQWNWDSATHAMGLVHIDEQRAFDELYALISGQWNNGLIAQITFNPAEVKYFPGPKFWGTEQFAHGEIITSGITQPPLLAISVNYVYQHAKNRQNADIFLKTVLPAVMKFHNYLKTYRDPENCGLLTVVHPWEAGTDNSPRWDSLLENIQLNEIPDQVKILVNTYRSDDKLGDTKDRPGLEDYYRYMYLVHLFKQWNWDYTKIVAESPFAIKDILFNSLWCKANDSLAELLKVAATLHINEYEKHYYVHQAEKYCTYATQTRAALLQCWDEEVGQFCDINVTKGMHQPIKENTIATFMPLWAKATNEKIITVLLKKLQDPQQYWSPYPVPTTALNSAKFELTRYWRGPTWPVTNFFLIEGLKNYLENKNCAELSRTLIHKTLSMIAENGFYEYFDPTSGNARASKADTHALGFGTFSWTAAIFIYLMSEYRI